MRWRSDDRISSNLNENNGFQDAIHDIRDTFMYLKKDEILKLVLITNVLVTVVVMPYLNLLPGYVADLFDGGAGKLGTIMAVGGIGSFMGSIIIAATTKENTRNNGNHFGCILFDAKIITRFRGDALNGNL